MKTFGKHPCRSLLISSLTGDSTKYVSVVSKEHVSIKGFDGSAYLDSLANGEPSNPATPRGQEATELWQDVKDKSLT